MQHMFPSQRDVYVLYLKELVFSISFLILGSLGERERAPQISLQLKRAVSDVIATNEGCSHRSHSTL
jgi:hypothetical protein